MTEEQMLEKMVATILAAINPCATETDCAAMKAALTASFDAVNLDLDDALHLTTGFYRLCDGYGCQE